MATTIIERKEIASDGNITHYVRVKGETGENRSIIVIAVVVGIYFKWWNLMFYMCIDHTVLFLDTCSSMRPRVCLCSVHVVRHAIINSLSLFLSRQSQHRVCVSVCCTHKTKYTTHPSRWWRRRQRSFATHRAHSTTLSTRSFVCLWCAVYAVQKMIRLLCFRFSKRQLVFREKRMQQHVASEKINLH